MGEHLVSISSSYSPKSQEELRTLFNEKLSVLKAASQYSNDLDQNDEDNLQEVDDEEEHQLQPEADVGFNIQTQTDAICDDLIDALFEELGEGNILSFLY